MKDVTGYDKAGLILLNTHFFGDDIEQVKLLTAKINLTETGEPMFDFIYYANDGQIFSVG